MKSLLVLSIFVSFTLTLLILPKWIKKCRQIGLLWEDMNKFNRPKNVAASGGIVVVMSFVLALLSYVAMRTFIIDGNGINLEIFALLSVILILAIVGLTDDLLGWQHGGLSARFRIFFAFVASIPLIVIDVGVHDISLPFFGVITIGVLYPLFIIPLGIAGATITYNCLAGFNGLETGQGIIILLFLSFIAYITGSPWLALIGICMIMALLGFYFYNKFPAKVFPGDILTYSIGALIASMAILGNFERIAIFIFIPYLLETILKIRGKLTEFRVKRGWPQSFGIPKEDKSLELPYKKIYSLTHLSLFILKKFKRKVYERDVVYLIFIFQIIICLLALIIFRSILFI